MHTAEQVYRGSPGVPVGRGVITGFVAGRTLKVRLRPRVEVALVRATLAIKKSRSDTDAAALFKVTIDTTAQSYGQIVQAGPAVKADLQWTITPAQTRALGGTAYWYEIAGIDADGQEIAFDAGQWYLPDFAVDDIDAGNINYIDLTPATANVLVGATVQLTATPRDSLGNALTGRTLSWFVNDADLAEVSATGLVTVKAAGTIYVFVRAGDVGAWMTITASTDDVGLLVSDLGGNASVQAFFDVRRNVRVGSGNVYLWEDARIPVDSTSGFYFSQYGDGINHGLYPGLDGQSRASVVLWYQSFRNDSRTMVGQGDVWRLMFDPSSTKIRLSMNTGAQLADFPAPLPGVPTKISLVYDGSGATNADRVKLYLSTYDRATGVWSADALQALTFTGTFPATWPTSSAQQLAVGYHPVEGWSNVGVVDELRVWAGASLSAGQVGAETLAASPAAPNLRYTYANGTATNSGSTAGYDGTIVGINVVASADNRFAAPLFAISDTTAPAWDATNKYIVFNDSTDYFHSNIGGTLLAWGRQGGFSVVLQGFPSAVGESQPDGIVSVKGNAGGSSGDRVLLGASSVESPAGTSNLSTHATQTAAGATIAPAYLVAQAGRRVFHSRRTVTGGGNDFLTAFHRQGSNAEVASVGVTMDIFDDPAQLIVGKLHLADASFSDLSLRAVVLYSAASAAKQNFVNSWAAQASVHAVTLV